MLTITKMDCEVQDIEEEINEKEETIDDTAELAMFREQWKAELKEKSLSKTSQDNMSQAEELYWMGVYAEQSRDMAAAILYYRQAVQLVPDIETRATHQYQVSKSIDLDIADDTENIEEEEVTVAISTLSLDNNDDTSILCLPNTLSKGSTHISTLPVEIFRYILSLVVIPDLDLRSLEQFGMVCKGFHLLARENLLWQQACYKLWGKDITPSINWRYTFISRPHIHFNGVYISRSSYIRPGERSLDHLYKPFHTVVYYRYLRFFADGSVLYMTSPEEPGQVINRLRYKKQSDAILLGYYTMSDDTIHIVVTRSVISTPITDPSPRSRRRRAPPEGTSYDQRFHMELGLKHSMKKLSSQLHWKEFSCHNVHRFTGHLQVTDFTLDYTYTPFYFSRVKSYSLPII